MQAEHDNADIALWRTMYALKTTLRQGWLDRGIPEVDTESVADHSHLTAMIAWVVALGDDTLDADRVLQLATIHDVAESIVGDRPPYDAHEVPDPSDTVALRAFFSTRKARSAENAAAKRADETAAMARILELLLTSASSTWAELWAEYETQESPESRFVKQVDRLEAFIQSRLYAERYPDVPVEGFTDMAMHDISHPRLVEIRDAFLSS